jgi:Ca2+-binding EF-hand superfamily protein
VKFTAPKINDTFEVLVYAAQRPVRVRVAALFEGRPADALWRDRLKKLFDFCDRDGDGSLSEKEAKFAFTDQGLAQLLANGFYQPGQAAPAFGELDRDGDGRVSPEELAASYGRSAAQLLRPMPTQADVTNNAAVTEAVFKLLDADGDGKLTREEVKAAEKLIAGRDADEDECLDVAELAPGTFDPRLGRPVQLQLAQLDRNNPGRPAGPQIVHVYAAGRVPGTVTQQVIKRYDRDGDFELTRAEVGFDEATFKGMDADGNGRLDGEELDAWRTGTPDLEVTLSTAPKPADCKATVADEKAAVARGLKLNRMGDGRLILHVGRQSIDFAAFSSGAQSGQASLKQQYGYLFAQAAGLKDSKGYLTEKDLSGPNAVQFQFLRVIFEPADRDADGKLTRAEFDAYFDLQDAFRNLSLGLTPGVQTPSLFQLLDENGDGRLGVRELRTAWPRLLALEESDAGVVTKNVIQPAVTLRLSRTTDRFFVNQVNFAALGSQNPNRVPVPTKGPLWFRKMDRNGDGDVSRTEYLGAKAEFDAIDSDRDDLISLGEAESWDKKNREKGPQKAAGPKPDAPKPDRKKDEK